jgi:hypothetical protein
LSGVERPSEEDEESENVRGHTPPTTIIIEPSRASQGPSRSDSATIPPAGVGGTIMR